MASGGNDPRSRTDWDLCVIGSGPSAQAVAGRAAGAGLNCIVLEAGGSGESDRSLVHQMGSDVPVTGTHAPDPAAQISMRVGGSIDLPRVECAPGASPTGIRVALLEPTDFAGRPSIGAAGWPIGFDDLLPYWRQAADDYGIEGFEPLVTDFPGDLGPSRPFWCVDRRLASSPGPERFGGSLLVEQAPVSHLTFESDGSVRSAVVRSAGEDYEVVAKRFVLAAGTYSSTRILLQSSLRDGTPAANSSGLLGVGLMDHPQLHLGRLSVRPGADLELLKQFAPRRAGDGAFWPKLVSRDDQVGIAVTLLPASKQHAHHHEPPRFLGGLHAAQELADRIREHRIGRDLPLVLARAALGAPDLVRLAMNRRKRDHTEWSFEVGWWGDLVAQADLGQKKAVQFDVLAFVEQLPSNANRVTLSNEVTRLGWRRLDIAWSWSRKDRKLADDAATPILDHLEKALGPIKRTKVDDHVHKFSCHHGSGTMRMSSDPATGVVDPNCRVHDHSNLYVVGTGIFPNIGYANPTFTDVALGLRLGDHLSGLAATAKVDVVV